MRHATTAGELIEKFDHYIRYSDRSVLIHPGLPFNFLEVTPQFTESLKKALMFKLAMIKTGMEPMDPITKFAVMMLEDSY